MLLSQPRCAALQARTDATAPPAGRFHFSEQQLWCSHQRQTLTAPRPAAPQRLFSQASGIICPAAGSHTCSSHAAAAAFPPYWGSQQRRPPYAASRRAQELASPFSARARPAQTAASAQGGSLSSGSRWQSVGLLPSSNVGRRAQSRCMPRRGVASPTGASHLLLKSCAFCLRTCVHLALPSPSPKLLDSMRSSQSTFLFSLPHAHYAVLLSCACYRYKFSTRERPV